MTPAHAKLPLPNTDSLNHRRGHGDVQASLGLSVDANSVLISFVGRWAFEKARRFYLIYASP